MMSLSKFRVHNGGKKDCMVVYDIIESSVYNTECILGLPIGSIDVYIDNLHMQYIIRMYVKNVEILLLGINYKVDKKFDLYNIVITNPNRNKGIGTSIIQEILKHKDVKKLEICDIINDVMYKIIKKLRQDTNLKVQLSDTGDCTIEKGDTNVQRTPCNEYND